MVYLFPDPGVLPTLPTPKSGERILINVKGDPPYKDIGRSIRNTKHPRYETFIKLRQEAIKVMNDRKWYDGPVTLIFTYYAPKLKRTLLNYIEGISDTLDGSHGYSFTYLPIVFQDDYQVSGLKSKFVESKEIKYTVEIIFLDK